MLAPVKVHADLEANAYEITYRHLGEGEHVDRDEWITASGSAGINASGNVIAIELLASSRRRSPQRGSMRGNTGSRFPRDLAGVLATA